MKKPLDILREYWGYHKFHSLQEKVINCVLSRKDCLVLLPTGGGKSICFQVPALCKEGICIVISPLVSLIKDQVNRLKHLDIKAIGLTGTYHHQELERLLNNCIYGGYKFLYISPERLQNTMVREYIQSMPVSMIAIDEAHCISQWGHDFRPAYRQIPILKTLHPDVPFIALTATATARVTKDIVSSLELADPTTFSNSFERTNISYCILKSPDIRLLTTEIVKRNEYSTIVYVGTRKESSTYANIFQQLGLKATYFHGGFSDEEKEERLQLWLSDKVNIMVATSSFGMGIDKPNVRTIVHVHIPESIESYYQETGRAGRDGKPSEAFLLYNEQSIKDSKYLYLENYPDISFLKRLYYCLNQYFRIPYGEGEGFESSFSLYSFAKRYNLDYVKAHMGIRTLENNGVVRYVPNHKKQHLVQFFSHGEQLKRHLYKHPFYNLIVHTILRRYEHIHIQPTSIDIKKLHSILSVSQKEIIECLEQLEKLNIISYQANEDSEYIYFLTSREDEYTIHTFAKSHKELVASKHDKMKALTKLITQKDKCINKYILEYFGQSKDKNCFNCNVCKPLSNISAKELERSIIKILKTTPYTLEELVRKFDFEQRPNVLQITYDFIKNQVIGYTKDEKLYFS